MSLKKIPTNIRQAVYARDNAACILCGDDRVIHLHHNVLRSHGGRNAVDNLVCLCPICHAIAHGEYAYTNRFPFDMATAQDAIHYYLEYTIYDPEYRETYT